jgi:hypothetical protein
VLKSGRLQVRLRNTRNVRPGLYQLKIAVAGTTRTVKVRVHAASPRNVST